MRTKLQEEFKTATPYYIGIFILWITMMISFYSIG